MVLVPSLLLALATFAAVVETASIFSSNGASMPPSNSIERRLDLFTNGFPGFVCNPDAYNTLDNNWNRTYTESEPQQIHISVVDDAQYVRAQFATLGEINHSVLQYWPKDNTASATTVKGEDWVFTDGGIKKRKLYLHKFKTNILTPATVYSYKVGSATNANDSSAIQWSQIYEFHSASNDNEFSFLATGDIGACNAVSVAHLKTEAKTHKYDFVSIAGDQAYNMDDFSGTKGDQYLNFMQDLYANIPYLGAPGNHEAAYKFSHYKNRFNIVPYADSNSSDSLFYSINYKSLHLVSFSTEVFFKGGDVKAALNWLDADLTKANKNRAERPWIIFLTHHPIYCSSIGISADCTINAGVVRNGWLSSGGVEAILEKHKVDIYVSGHVHNYERTYPVYKNKMTANSYHNAPNLFQMVIGNGGQPEGVAKFSALGGKYPEWSAVRYENYGYTTFRVTPTAIDITHRATHKDGTLGDIVDQFSVTKDPIPNNK